jgi:hypothetical protein
MRVKARSFFIEAIRDAHRWLGELTSDSRCCPFIVSPLTNPSRVHKTIGPTTREYRSYQVASKAANGCVETQKVVATLDV